MNWAVEQFPHAKLMSVEFESFDKEREEIVLRFTAPEHFRTPRGFCQGGLVAGFLDEGMGWAHVWATDHAEAPLNLEINMTLVRAVPIGPLKAKGRVVKRGRRVTYLESELFDLDGELLARATSTALVTERPGPPSENAG